MDIRNVLSSLITDFLAFVLSSVIGLPIVYYLIKDPKGTTFFNPSKSQDIFPEDTMMLKRRISALERDLETSTRKLSNLPFDINHPDYPVNEILRESSFDKKD